MGVHGQPGRVAGVGAECVPEPRLLAVRAAEWLGAGLAGDSRKIGEPALPDSIGRSAIRWSKAPIAKAALPYREQPVTPVASARRMLPPDCSMTSMSRLTPQAQATTSPVLFDEP